MARHGGNSSRFTRPKGRPPALNELLEELLTLHAVAAYPSARWIARENEGVTQGQVLKLLKNFPENQPPRVDVLQAVVAYLAQRAHQDEQATVAHFDTLFRAAVVESTQSYSEG